MECQHGGRRTACASVVVPAGEDSALEAMKEEDKEEEYERQRPRGTWRSGSGFKSRRFQQARSFGPVFSGL